MLKPHMLEEVCNSSRPFESNAIKRNPWLALFLRIFITWVWTSIDRVREWAKTMPTPANLLMKLWRQVYIVEGKKLKFIWMLIQGLWYSLRGTENWGAMKIGIPTPFFGIKWQQQKQENKNMSQLFLNAERRLPTTYTTKFRSTKQWKRTQCTKRFWLMIIHGCR